MLKAQPVTGQCPLSECTALSLHWLLKILIKIGEVEVILVHAADRGEACGERGLTLLEDHQVHGHLAQGKCPGNRLNHHPGVGGVKG